MSGGSSESQIGWVLVRGIIFEAIYMLSPLHYPYNILEIILCLGKVEDRYNRNTKWEKG